MARPVVLIYQEFATTTVTPDTPELNSIVVGPCYWIMDYLDNKASIRAASDYGTLAANNTYTAPAVGTDALTIADPPGNKVGALLDATSVQIYFDEARVLITQDVGTPTTGVLLTADSNKVDANSASGLVLADVQAGDYFIVTNPAGGNDIIKRVLSVDVSGKYIYTTTNFIAGDGITKYKSRLERQVNNVAIASSFVVVTGNEIIVQGGVTTVLTGETSARVVNYAKVYVQYRSLRQDLRTVGSVSSSTERSGTLATDNGGLLGKNDARNPLCGVVAIAQLNTTTPIQYYGVTSDDQAGHTEAMEVLQGRKDIYAIVPITLDRNILASYKVENEGLASVTNAETTGIPQKFRVVIGALNLITTKTVSPTSSYDSTGTHLTVDEAIPGTPISTADGINVFVDPALTSSTGFVAKGIRADDTLVIVSDSAASPRTSVYTVAEVYDNQRLRVSGTFVGTDKMAGNVQYYIIRGTGTPVTGTTCVAAVATTGPDKLTADAGIVGTAAQVGSVLRVTTGALPADNGDWLVTASAVATPAQWTPVASTQNPPVGAWTATTAIGCSLVAPLLSVTVARQVTTRRCFRYICDNNALYLTNLVIAGDYLDLPNPLSGTSFTSYFRHTVSYIPSENTLVLAANTDVEATNPEIGDVAVLKSRVDRSLNKDDQVSELVAIAQSFVSRRVIFVWPDEVTVAALVDGSKPRTISTQAEAADAQPGYYLAGVVGGMTSGLPSHQGFTNLGIAGVSSIGHSTRYFSDGQLTELSDGGWFVFGQETPNTLPYCIHQLTTDPSTLESGEYSVVKNFDFISIFFQDILEEFLGIWNINDETLAFLKQSLNQGIDILKLRKYAKIGSPLNSADITSLAASTASADRVEIYMEVGLPKPLNRIGLHLISV